MFKRKALHHLSEWFKAKKRKPLILRGARQVGKSSLVQLFAQEQSLQLIEVNFELTTLESLLKSQLDIDEVIREIELYNKVKIQTSKHLIFFDEIQKSPQALKALRYFFEKRPEIAIIAAGSLLDFLLRDETISFPVGRVEFLYLGPVTFSEFLQATEQELLLDEFNRPLSKVPAAAHRMLMEQYRLFCCIGGMPESIQAYIDSKDLFYVRRIHRSILQTYKADFLKYSKKHEIFRCDKIFDYVPSHLGQKIKFSEIDSHEKSRDLLKALKTLLYARVIFKSQHTNATAVPLRVYADESVFKLYFLDVGLVLTHLEEDFNQVLHGESVLSGPIAEQFVQQHVAYLNPYQDPELFYWLRDKRKDKAEVDLVLAIGQQIIPVEVKARKAYNLKSLNLFFAEHPLHQNKKLQLGQKAIVISGEAYLTDQLVKNKAVLPTGSQEVEYSLTQLPLWAVERIAE